jgi:pimeloyl-ACP methyl ester carboxylesterase
MKDRLTAVFPCSNGRADRTVPAMLETRLLRIAAPDDGSIQLGILEKRSTAVDRRLPPVLLLHGATFGARLFDLPRAGYSLMAELAGMGRAVYALDLRGYGHSLGGAVMEQPPAQNPPFSGVDEATTDINAAVDVILERQSAAGLDLVGFSWGTVTAARYAGEHPEKIVRLALYAPLYGEINAAWLDRIADARDRARLASTFGAYRLVTAAEVIRRWNSDLPTDDPALYREDGIPELVFETLSALDPRSPLHQPAAFRCPNGALAGMVGIFNGQPLYDPAKLTMPTLLVRGDDDTTSTDRDARRLLARIASPEKQYCVIAPGSHFLCIERNRAKLYRRLAQFFTPP